MDMFEKSIEVRAKLSEMAFRLRALSKESKGELMAEAALAWLYSQEPFGRMIIRVSDVVVVLNTLNETVAFVRNWSDCTRVSIDRTAQQEADFHDNFIEPAQRASDEALAAVCEYVDMMREERDAGKEQVDF